MRRTAEQTRELLVRRFSERKIAQVTTDGYVVAIMQQEGVDEDVAWFLLWEFTPYPFGDEAETYDAIEHGIPVPSGPV